MRTVGFRRPKENAPVKGRQAKDTIPGGGIFIFGILLYESLAVLSKLFCTKAVRAANKRAYRWNINHSDSLPTLTASTFITA